MEKENIYWSSFSQNHQPTHWPSLETSSQASKLRYDPLTDRLTGVKCRATSVARNVKHMSRPWYPCPYYKKNLLHHSFSKACVYTWVSEVSAFVFSRNVGRRHFLWVIFQFMSWCDKARSADHLFTVTCPHWLIELWLYSSTFLLFHCSAFLSSAFVRFPYPSRICVSRCGCSEYLCIRNG